MSTTTKCLRCRHTARVQAVKVYFWSGAA
eukprot:IDg8552t1